VRENVCRPYGTRIYFPLYPALRLRLRAGLDYSAPRALDIRPSSPLANTKVGFSHTSLAPDGAYFANAGAKAPAFCYALFGTTEVVP